MPAPHVHDHSQDDVRVYSLPYAVPELPVDLQAVAALYDAAIDDCKACIQERLEPVADDAATTASLVGWACLIMAETYGGFPNDLLAHTSPESAAFNTMASLYQRTWGSGSPTEVVHPAAVKLTWAERRTACVWALGLVLAPDPYEAGLPSVEDCCPECAGQEDGDILIVTDNGITLIPNNPV
ncbi:hypothetical protein [Kitasatospora sp. NPDC088346]|uniref:hypothetical protein n=1 Tax=Kitasatospora sp. NPDC088346 TaxID=3364073 RepID=UPI00381A1E15